MSSSFQWFLEQSTGENYYWSPHERCYVFQSGRRHYPPGTQQAAQTQPVAVPRRPPAPQASPPANVPFATSPTSPGSQSPGYTHRNRAPSFASVGSSGHASQHGEPPPPQSQPTIGRQPPSASTGVGRSHGGHYQYEIAPLAPRLAGLNLGASNNTPGHIVPRETATEATTQSGTAPGMGDSAPTPSTSGPATRMRRNIAPTLGDYEELDPRYRRRPSKWFKLGRVFKMHWSEPSGRGILDDNATVVTPMQEPLPKQYEKQIPREFVRDRRFGQFIYSKIRWFIVVRPGTDKCICVPIITYQGQGVSKAGVVKGEHAIVYTIRRAPDPLPTEVPRRVGDKPMRTPIRIRADEKGDLLMNMSRIDYGRVYTIEHNVKAMAFGWVHEDSEKDFNYDFRDVFFGSQSATPARDTQGNQDGEDEEDDSEDSSESAEEANAVETPGNRTTAASAPSGSVPERSASRPAQQPSMPMRQAQARPQPALSAEQAALLRSRYAQQQRQQQPVGRNPPALVQPPQARRLTQSSTCVGAQDSDESDADEEGDEEGGEDEDEDEESQEED
ncbi:hypothetical protein LTR37_009092 [Vermiconidia calcicola]|uniref:Uncharacterized protein n=1 Tax=Vermiconidia calcicola TaxID=1690605 RepID=A0ACC3N8L1_9PEZI|nr:hypothetical protein LTR37_009092 [Vermiconidia calcicola]